LLIVPNVLQTLNLINPFTLAVGGIFHLFKKALYKSEEYEADRVAIELLSKAGLTQRGAITLFEKFLKKSLSKIGLLEKSQTFLIEDHPYTEKRLKD